MPDMNNYTVEGLRAQRDALLAALKLEALKHEYDADGYKKLTPCGCSQCFRILKTLATIEALPPRDPVDIQEWKDALKEMGQKRDEWRERALIAERGLGLS